MADVMQFIRELLEAHPAGTILRGVVTHAVRVFTDDPSDPAIYELQMEISGYTYSGMAYTRDPNLASGMPMGIEVSVAKTQPNTEGYPIFLKVDLYVAPLPPPPQVAPQPQAVPQPPVPPAQPMPQQPEVIQPPVAPPAPVIPQEQLHHGVENAPVGTERFDTQVPFNANAADDQRQGQ